MGFLGHYTVMKTELVNTLVENSVEGSKKFFSISPLVVVDIPVNWRQKSS